MTMLCYSASLLGGCWSSGVVAAGGNGFPVEWARGDGQVTVGTKKDALHLAAPFASGASLALRPSVVAGHADGADGAAGAAWQPRMPQSAFQFVGQDDASSGGVQRYAARPPAPAAPSLNRAARRHAQAAPTRIPTRTSARIAYQFGGGAGATGAAGDIATKDARHARADRGRAAVMRARVALGIDVADMASESEVIGRIREEARQWKQDNPVAEFPKTAVEDVPSFAPRADRRGDVDGAFLAASGVQTDTSGAPGDAPAVRFDGERDQPVAASPSRSTGPLAPEAAAQPQQAASAEPAPDVVAQASIEAAEASSTQASAARRTGAFMSDDARYPVNTFASVQPVARAVPDADGTMSSGPVDAASEAPAGFPATRAAAVDTSFGDASDEAVPVADAPADDDATRTQFATEESMPANGRLAVGKFSFPDNLLGALREGLEVPVRLKTDASAEDAGKATVKYTDGALLLTRLALPGTSLNERGEQELKALYGKPLRVVSETSPATPDVHTISTEFNLRTFELVAQIPRDAYGSKSEARLRELPDSTEKHLSGVINYDMSGVKNSRQDPNGYLHLRSVTGYGVNHAYVEGDMRTGDTGGDLYEARLERDFHGFKFMGGYLSTWSMTSALGQTTFLPSGKFIGVSGGNVSRSEMNDGSLARTPIFVFMPASGEVQIYRDDKLINVQPLPVGNHEIDTRPLPVGTYQIRIDTVVNGRVQGSQMAPVYKPGDGSSGAGTQFQFYGGQYISDGGLGGTVSQPLFGASGKKDTVLGTFYGSAYYFDSLGAIEARYQRSFSHGSVSLNSGVTSDGGLVLNANANANLGPVGAWASYGMTSGSTRRNGTYDQHTASVGGMINVGQIMNWHNNATLNINTSVYNGTQDYRLDWNQDVYSNRWVRLSLSAGETFSRGGMRSRGWNNAFYVSLNAAFTFGDAGIDYSRSLYSEQVGAHVGWRPERLPGVDYINAGVNHSRDRAGGGYGVYRNGTTQANLGATGSNRWFGWQANGSVDDRGQTSGTGSFQGSVGWNGSGVGFNSRGGEAGVIVGLDKASRGQLDLVTGGQRRRLDSRSTFVPLSEYGSHEIQVQTRRDTPENYDVQGGDSKVVLYPGNVAAVKPRIRRLVTVFGTLIDDGKAQPNVELRNHIGRSTTDPDGNFVIDVDSSYPTVQYRTGTGSTCEIGFDLSKAKGAVWVDKVGCEPRHEAQGDVPKHEARTRTGMDVSASLVGAPKG